MNIRNTVIAVLLLVFVMIALVSILPQPQGTGGNESGKSSFSIVDISKAGNYGYAVIDNQGEANVTLIAYSSAPQKKVFLLNDSEAIGADKFPELADQLQRLTNYGFSVDVRNDKLLSNGIYLVPTGAMPSYILDDLRFNASNAMIIFIGRPDLLIKNGVRKEDWYSGLEEGQRTRLVLINSTLDDYLSSNNSLPSFILENGWAAKAKTSFHVAGQGRKTLSLLINNSEYIRLLWQSGEDAGIVDSSMLPADHADVLSSPQSIFPWEKAELTFTLNRTNGTAVLSVLKDGVETYVKELDRVREENYFLEYFQPKEPGDYIVRVVDNSGVIGGGVVHVKNLQLSYQGSRGYSYVFNVVVDGEPVKNVEAKVSLENSTMVKTFYVSDGELTVPAELKQGLNNFNIKIFNTTRKIEVNYESEGLLNFYIKYGSISLALIAAVYFWARMSRSPVYTIRIGEIAGEIRKDLHMPVQSAIAAFKSVRKELGIGNSPITAHEFSIALKRHVTEGADVTEGNVEEIMQRLVSKGLLESHRQYYQLKGEGDIRRNALMRRVRDRLIEAGITFKVKSRKFVTGQFEIGFFGEKFLKNAIIVVEDQQELDTIMKGLSQKELSVLQIKIANGVTQFVTIDRLDDVL